MPLCPATGPHTRRLNWRFVRLQLITRQVRLIFLKASRPNWVKEEPMFRMIPICMLFPAALLCSLMVSPASSLTPHEAWDHYCRDQAAAATGYVSPDQAAAQAQANAATGGLLAGAAVGAIIGNTSRHAGTGAAIGAATGLIIGSAAGLGAAQAAAADVQAAYSQAYYLCMSRNANAPPPPSYEAEPEPDASYPPPPAPLPPGYSPGTLNDR